MDKGVVTEHHGVKIAEVLARMHLINLEVPEIEEAQFDVHTNDSMSELFRKTEFFKCPFVSELRECEASILAINDRYYKAIVLLREDCG